MGPHFLLSFGTTLGRTRTLRINNVNMSATAANVRDAMNIMISSHAISTPAAGRINTMRRAQRVETHITPIEIM